MIYASSVTEHGADNPPFQLIEDILAYWGFDNLGTQTILRNGVHYDRGVRYNTQGNNPDVGTTLESNKITPLSDYVGWYENNLSVFGPDAHLCPGAPNGAIGTDGATVSAIFRVTSVYETGYTATLTLTNGGLDDIESVYVGLYTDPKANPLVDVTGEVPWEYVGNIGDPFIFWEWDEPRPAGMFGEIKLYSFIPYTSDVVSEGYLLMAPHTRLPSGGSVVLNLTFSGYLGPDAGVYSFPDQRKYFLGPNMRLAPMSVLIPTPWDPDPQPSFVYPVPRGARPYSGFQGYFFNGPNSYLRNNGNSPKIASIGTGDFTISFFVAPSGPNGNPIQTVISTEEIGSAYPGYTNVGFSVYIDYTNYDPVDDFYRVPLGFKFGNFDFGPVCYVKINQANGPGEIKGRHGTDNYHFYGGDIVYWGYKDDYMYGYGDYTHITIIRNAGKYTVYRDFNLAFECDPGGITEIANLGAPRITIGGQWVNSGAGSITNSFHGAIDEIGIWKSPFFYNGLFDSRPLNASDGVIGGNLNNLQGVYNFGHTSWKTGGIVDGTQGAREYADYQYTYPFGYYVYIKDQITEYTVYSYNKLSIPIGLANGYIVQEFVLTNAVALIDYAEPNRSNDWGAQGIDWAPFRYSAATQTLSGRYDGLQLVRDRMSNQFIWFDDHGYGGYNQSMHMSYSYYNSPNFVNVGAPTPRDPWSVWFYDTGPGLSDPYGNTVNYSQEYFDNLVLIARGGVEGDQMKDEGIEIAYLVYIDTLSTVGMPDPGKWVRVQQRINHIAVNVKNGIKKPPTTPGAQQHDGTIVPTLLGSFIAGASMPEIVIDLSDRPDGNIKRATVNVFENVGFAYAHHVNNHFLAHMTPTAAAPSTDCGLTATISGKKLTISGTIPMAWYYYAVAGIPTQMKVDIVGEADTPGAEYEIYHVMDLPGFLLPFTPYLSPNYFEFTGQPIQNTLDFYFNPQCTTQQINNILSGLRDIEGFTGQFLRYRTFTNNENGDEAEPVVHDEPPDLNFPAGTSYSLINGIPSGLTTTRIPNYSISFRDETPLGIKTNPYILSGIAGSCGLVYWQKNETDFSYIITYFMAPDAPGMSRLFNLPPQGETVVIMQNFQRKIPIKTDINITPIKHVDIVTYPGQPITNNVNIPINITGTLVPGGLTAPTSTPYYAYDFGLPAGVSLQSTPYYALVGSLPSRYDVYDSDGNLIGSGNNESRVVIYAQGYNCLVAAPIEFLVDTFAFTRNQTFLNYHSRSFPPFIPSTNYPGWIESWGTPIGLPPGTKQDPLSGLVTGQISREGSGTTIFKAIHGGHSVDSYGIPWDAIFSTPTAREMIFRIPLFEYFSMTIKLGVGGYVADGGFTFEIVSGQLPNGITLDGERGELSGYSDDINYTPQILVIAISDSFGPLLTQSYPIFTDVNHFTIPYTIDGSYTLGNSAYDKIYSTDIPIYSWVYDQWGQYSSNIDPFEITKAGYIKLTHWKTGDYYNTREFQLFPVSTTKKVFYATTNEPYLSLSPGEYIEGQGILPGTYITDIDYNSTPYHYILNYPAAPIGTIKTIQAGLGLKVYNGYNIYEVIRAGNFGSSPPKFTNGSQSNGTAALRYISSFYDTFGGDLYNKGIELKTQFRATYSSPSPAQFNVQRNFSVGTVITGICADTVFYFGTEFQVGGLWVIGDGSALHRLDVIIPGGAYQENRPGNAGSVTPNTYNLEDIASHHGSWDSYDIIYRPAGYEVWGMHSVIGYQSVSFYPGSDIVVSTPEPAIIISAHGQIIQGLYSDYNNPMADINFNVYAVGGLLDGATLKGLAWDPTEYRFGDLRNRLYVANSSGNNILKIESFAAPDTGYITRDISVYARGSTALPLNDPTGIVFDEEGNLYVTNPGENNILKFPQGGGNSPELFADNIHSTGIARNLNSTYFIKNSIFVTDSVNSRIIEFSTSGEILKVIPSVKIGEDDSINSPTAITFERGTSDFIIANGRAFNYIVKIFNNKLFSNAATITINLDKGLPAITQNQTFSGTINVFIEFIVLRDNDNTINSWQLIDINNSNLGIYIDHYSGVISGIPEVAGLFSYLVKATNDQGEDTKEIIIDVAGIIPTIFQGQSFNLYIGNPDNASDAIQYSGTTADSWQIVSIFGGTPAIYINFLGQFTGRNDPKDAGTYTVYITATNRTGTSEVTAVQLNILLPYPVITPEQYVYTATNTNIDYDVAYIGSTPDHWELEIPQGTTLAISNSGKITGKITYEAQLSLLISASNASGVSEDRINIIAVASPPTITPNQVFSGKINVYFNSAILYSGTADIWSLTTGNVLPSGLTLDPSTGVISGIPTMAGIYTNISITALSDKGGRDIRTINIVISNVGSLIQIAEGQVINATGVSTFTFTPTYTGEPNRWDAANLPAWLTINHTTGTLTGTTTGIAHGSYSYCVYAKDDLGNSSAAFIKIQI